MFEATVVLRVGGARGFVVLGDNEVVSGRICAISVLMMIVTECLVVFESVDEVLFGFIGVTGARMVIRADGDSAMRVVNVARRSVAVERHSRCYVKLGGGKLGLQWRKTWPLYKTDTALELESYYIL